MEKTDTDILVIGGGPAGVVAAVTAEKTNPDKKITLVRDKEKGIIPCGIPYIFDRLDSVEKDIMPDDPLEANNINLIVDKAMKLDPNDRMVTLESEKKITYKRLILATGSRSTEIPIKTEAKQGVWYVKKDFEYLKKMRQAMLDRENIVIIGGGFIGVEFAEELSSIKGKKISIVEKQDSCLISSFDKEFASAVEEKLREKGVDIYTGSLVENISGTGRVESVKIDGKEIPADQVIISIGAKPNVDLARKAGLDIGECGMIKVNKYMETSKKGIFAIGDCAETRCLLTGKRIPVMLASTACHEARIAAANLYKKEDLINNDGTLAVFSTMVNGLGIGVAGLKEESAKEKGIEVVAGQSTAPNHHPGALPGTQKITVKLIFSKTSTELLGGQVTGPESVGEMVNILAMAIQNKTTIYDFNTLQIATHPLLTSAPTVYPLITAAQAALGKLKMKKE
jgi:NADPH-dependent 2,4-dienoyl-CoA reductase/sulfur reductase-like enzyme